jgi:hypothetical protein
MPAAGAVYGDHMSGRIIAVAILSLMVLACGATLSRSGKSIRTILACWAATIELLV